MYDKILLQKDGIKMVREIYEKELIKPFGIITDPKRMKHRIKFKIY